MVYRWLFVPASYSLSVIVLPIILPWILYVTSLYIKESTDVMMFQGAARNLQFYFQKKFIRTILTRNFWFNLLTIK